MADPVLTVAELLRPAFTHIAAALTATRLFGEATEPMRK